MTGVRENCLRVLDRIHEAAARSGRDPQSIRLIAVTKTVPPERIREAWQCGVTDVGENRLQEALPKREVLRDAPLRWHFIGHLQTNKAKKVLEHFNWIQCVDRPELAEKLNQCAGAPVPVLIEVKLEDEPNKSGIGEAGLGGFVKQFEAYERLQLRGLMAIPPLSQHPEGARPYFRKLRALRDRFGLAELSMGMSAGERSGEAEGPRDPECAEDRIQRPPRGRDRAAAERAGAGREGEQGRDRVRIRVFRRGEVRGTARFGRKE
jgi:pyridoxal phosphate enzyme (YggS family)